MTFETTHETPRELDARTGDGIEVRLLWHPTTDTVAVEVFDATHGDLFELVVDPAEALDVFHHPFAYAAFRGVDFAVPLRAHATDAEPVGV